MTRYTTHDSKRLQTKTIDVHTRESIDDVIVKVGSQCRQLTMLDGPIVSEGRAVEALTDVMRAAGKSNGIERMFIDMLREPIINIDENIGVGQQDVARLLTALVAVVFQLRAAGIDNESIATEIRSITTLICDVNGRRRRCFREEVDMLIDDATSNKRVSDIVRHALTLAGGGGHITFKTDDVKVPTISLTSGYVFDTVVPQTMSAFHNNTWSGSDVKIAIVDGFIESVANIDHILTRAHEERIPVILFARRFASEVITTAAVNARRNTLTFIPVVVSYDIESVNILKDIAAVVDGDVVSALTGQLVTNIDFDKLPVVDNVTVTTKGVEIKTDAGRNKINRYVASMRRELLDPERALSKNLITRRIQNLLGRSVVVRMSHADGDVLDVERAVRYVTNAIKYGIVKTDKISDRLNRNLETSKLPILTSTYAHWIDTMPIIMSAVGLALTCKRCQTNIELIMSAGAVIENA